MQPREGELWLHSLELASQDALTSGECFINSNNVIRTEMSTAKLPLRVRHLVRSQI